MKLHTSPRIDAPVLTLLAAAYLALACNVTFWRALMAATGPASLDHLPLQAACVLLVILLFNAALTLFSFRPLLKPALLVLFLCAALTCYFLGQYGTAIDRTMVQNLLETDLREARELLSWKLALTVLLLGVVPSVAVWRTQVRFLAGRRGLVQRGGVIAGSLLLAVVLLLMFFKSLAPVLREHRELRFLLIPTNVIQALNGYFKHQRARPLVVAPLGNDAVKGRNWTGNRRRSVTLIVVGETARAANFSLNGYARETNPELSHQAGLLNFTNMHSCGTATAVSLPCVFSVLGRDRYSDDKARGQQGLLDVLSHAGFNVLWRDNNSGCKGTCDRVAYEDLSQPEEGNPWCVDGECYDERLLDKLPEIIHNAREDLVVVLHQKGSHGPAYWKRYPAAYQRFSPVCASNELASCSRESIVAAYDNTILYTDHFLNRAIELLKASSLQDKTNTAMMYFSDHGESLGEHNIYLHGAPYFIAPEEQRTVPFMMWFSEGFRARFQIDQTCLAARTSQAISHDNVFHSVLGMLNVNTAVHNPRLDLFGACARHA